VTTVPDGVRVLIVDDSPVAREVLKHMLESDAGIRVVGMAASGREAVELTARLKPDLVTMDLVMPGMDGMMATQHIMARHPTPILFLSAFVGRDGLLSRSDAIAAGALDVIEKPMAMLDPEWQRGSGKLVATIKTLARVPVLTHMYGAPQRAARDVHKRRAPTTVVAIGASTGGPRVLDELLAALPESYAPAVVVVQHMAEEFMHSWLSALTRRCALDVKIAGDGDRIQPGRVLFAPPSQHLVVMGGGRVRLENGSQHLCPSVDLTFASVAQVYGARAAGVLLSGMGVDGASGLLAIKRAGGVTLAQDESSCVVFGMPRAAIKLGAVARGHSPAQLTRSLLRLNAVRSRHERT
jgi:two-component system chemotaxis response regulator CheB